MRFTCWIAGVLGSEIIEIILQSQALILYGGDSALALRPEMVSLFASILALNCVLSALLWLFFLFAPRRCGNLLVFKIWIVCRFVVFLKEVSFEHVTSSHDVVASSLHSDQVTDLLYTLFPLYVIVADDFNSADNVSVVLGQLNSGSALPFLSTAVPLFFLCTKSLLLAVESQRELRSKAYAQWLAIHNLTSCANDADTINLAKAHDVDLDIAALRHFNGELFDQNGQFRVALNSTNHQNGQNVDSAQRLSVGLKAALSSICALFIVFAAVMLPTVHRHFDETETHCGSVAESMYFENGTFGDLTASQRTTLGVNPELFLWDHCRFKVYPFTSDDVEQCQCRVFVLDFEDLNSTEFQRDESLNLTAQRMVDGLLNHWFMIEKLRISGTNVDGPFVTIHPLVGRPLEHLKALEFQVNHLLLSQDDPRSCSKITFFKDFVATSRNASIWKFESLEFLSFQNTITALQVRPGEMLLE